jgi:hypothetical protein
MMHDAMRCLNAARGHSNQMKHSRNSAWALPTLHLGQHQQRRFDPPPLKFSSEPLAPITCLPRAEERWADECCDRLAPHHCARRTEDQLGSTVPVPATIFGDLQPDPHGGSLAVTASCNRGEPSTQ